MKTPPKFPKSLVIALVFAFGGIIGIKFCLQDNKNSVTSIDIQIQKEVSVSTRNIKKKRAIASKAHHIQNSIHKTSLPKSKSIELVEQKYFSFLPQNIEWSVTPVKSTSKGQQVKIRLKDNNSGKKTSYHALVEPKSGKILTTWHREIRH